MDKGIKNKEVGRKIFHLICISKSYRNRGYDPRTQSNIKVIKIRKMIDVLKMWEKNKNEVINLRINILKYSARKINANHPPINSTLNPDTSSDSPSAKSNGLRLVSAKHLEIHIKNKIKLPQMK